MERRIFLKQAAITAASLASASNMSAAKTPSNPIAKRTLGKTGEKLSIIGFGGIVVMDQEPTAAANIVSEAVDRGINYFDVAPSYGNAQERLGPALAPYRKNCFLACKTDGRMKDDSRAQLEESLKLLKTDHVDLYQFHALTKMADLDKVLGPGGAMETMEAAKKEGKIRYIGFSVHSADGHPVPEEHGQDGVARGAEEGSSRAQVLVSAGGVSQRGIAWSALDARPPNYRGHPSWGREVFPFGNGCCAELQAARGARRAGSAQRRRWLGTDLPSGERCLGGLRRDRCIQRRILEGRDTLRGDASFSMH